MGAQPASRQGQSNFSARTKAAHNTTHSCPAGPVYLASQSVTVPVAATGASTGSSAALALSQAQTFTVPFAKAQETCESWA